MFTGIVEEVGILRKITANGKSGKVTILSNKISDGTNLGDSIAVNGVCLTVSNLGKNEFTADVMMETIRSTNLGLLNANDKVNLERAISLSSRFGGHIVTGHVDGKGTICKFEKDENAVLVSIRPDKKLLSSMILKGSVAIDGVSLTISYLDDEIFKVSIIPHTKINTILLTKNVGDFVNLESDVIGKYVNNFMANNYKELNSNSSNHKSNIDKDFLFKNGF